MGTRQLVPPTPNPAKTRPTMKVARLVAPVCNATPTLNTTRKIWIPCLLPAVSLRKFTKLRSDQALSSLLGGTGERTEISNGVSA